MMAEASATNECAVIGITTFSCVDVVRIGKVEIIPNGIATTPSFVAFNEHECTIRYAAKQQIAANLAEHIFRRKAINWAKIRGSNTHMKQWPFKVVKVHERPNWKSRMYKGEVKRVLLASKWEPQKICLFTHQRMRRIN